MTDHQLRKIVEGAGGESSVKPYKGRQSGGARRSRSSRSRERRPLFDRDNMASEDEEPELEENIAARYEHVAKMSRFVDFPRAEDSETPLPVIRIRTGIGPSAGAISVPISKDAPKIPRGRSARRASREVAPDIESEDRRKSSRSGARHHYRQSRSHHRQSTASDTSEESDWERRAARERRLNKERQREFERRDSTSTDSRPSTPRPPSRGRQRNRARGKEEEIVPRAQVQLQQRAPAPPNGEQQHIDPYARKLQESRRQRWRHPGDSQTDEKLGRNMRAAPKQRSRASSVDGSSVASRPASVRDQVLFGELQYQREHQAKNELLHRAAQQLVNEAYLAQEEKAHRKGQEERQHASKLLDEAFPLVKTTSQSESSTPLSVASDGGRRSKKLRKRSKKKNQSKESAVEKLLAGETLTGLPLYSGSMVNLPHSDLSGSDRSERSEVVGSWSPPVAGDSRGVTLSRDEKQLLLQAIKTELGKHNDGKR